MMTQHTTTEVAPADASVGYRARMASRYAAKIEAHKHDREGACWHLIS